MVVLSEWLLLSRLQLHTEQVSLLSKPSKRMVVLSLTLQHEPLILPGTTESLRVYLSTLDLVLDCSVKPCLTIFCEDIRMRCTGTSEQSCSQYSQLQWSDNDGKISGTFPYIHTDMVFAVTDRLDGCTGGFPQRG